MTEKYVIFLPYHQFDVNGLRLSAWRGHQKLYFHLEDLVSRNDWIKNPDAEDVKMDLGNYRGSELLSEKEAYTLNEMIDL